MENQDHATTSGMTQEREGAILEGAIQRFGNHNQILVAIEEMGELTKELTKYIRVDQSTYRHDHVLEEMADVLISLNQLALIFGDPTEYEIKKLERLERRIHELSV